MDEFAEAVEGDDAGGADEFLGLGVVGVALLRADAGGGGGGESGERRETGLIAAHEQALVHGHVAIGEIDDAGTLVGDGDAVAGEIELAGGDALDHGIPRDLAEDRGEAEAAAELGGDIVVPTLGGAGVGADKVEGHVAVLDGEGNVARGRRRSGGVAGRG